MLSSLILQLQAEKDLNFSSNLGRASQALFLQWIAAQSSQLAEKLHTMEGPKPFTVSNLVMGKREKGRLRVRAGETGWLRFTGLTAAVSKRLAAITANPPAEIELERKSLTVTGVTLDPANHPWAGQTRYQDLAAPYLLAGENPAPQITLEFASPTTFRSRGQYLPLPLPHLVFGSLLNRWQAFSAIELNPEVHRFAAETVALNRFRLKSRGIPSKAGGMQIGFTGRVTFSALNRERYWLDVLHLLAAFAFYSGVGYQTGAGLGQARVSR